jgi:hypothetical protein
MDAGTVTAGYFLKTDGSALSWSEVSIPTTGDITTANNFFQNWNEISTSTVSTFATTINAAIIGPISIKDTGGVPTIWSVNGTLNIL